ncbi:MAG TPA: phosphotransferase, partial [Nitrospirota bacterium]
SLLFDWLGERLGVRVADASMYPGSGSSGRRRATLLAMDAAGHPVAVIKVADTLPGMDVNKKEAEVLELLGRDYRFRGIAPGVICSGGWQGHQVLALEYMRPAGCRYVTGLTSAHTRFLESLSGLDRREALLHEWTGWRRLLDWSDKNGFKTDDDADAVRQTIKRCAGILSGLKLTMHRIHGDFSPWNTFLAGDRLVVFDWEHSEPCGLPFYDLVHFVIRRKHYIDNEPLSHGELLAATPESLGVREEVLALGSAVPQIKDARGKDRADISGALFRLCVLYAAAVKTSVRR